MIDKRLISGFDIPYVLKRVPDCETSAHSRYSASVFRI